MIMVSDTSVLVDLDRGSLLDAAFRLSSEFAVPDLLYKRELENHSGDRLRRLSITVTRRGKLSRTGLQVTSAYPT